MQSLGGLAVLRWTLVSDLDVRVGGQIVIRHTSQLGGSWENSPSLQRVAGGTTVATVPLKPGLYLVRAEDSTGVLGPVATVECDGLQILQFFAATTALEHPTYSGANSGTVQIDGSLTLTTSSLIDSWADFDSIASLDYEGPLLVAGTYTFANRIVFASVKPVRVRSLITMAASSLTSEFDSFVAMMDDWPDFDGSAGAEVDCWVEARTTQTDPAGSPVWTGWARIDSTEISAWGVEFRAQLITTNAAWGPLVSALSVTSEELR